MGKCIFKRPASTMRGRHWRSSLYDVVRAFLDESFDQAPSGLFVVGGIMAQGVALFELERKWEQLRKSPEIDIAYFKASECQHARGEFAKFAAVPGSPTAEERQRLRAISCQFLSLIGKEQVCLHGIGVLQDDFYNALRSPRARDILGDSPYRLAYNFALIQCAWAMKQVENDMESRRQKTLGNGPTRDYVSFVCDEHEEHGPEARKSYESLKETNPEAAKYMTSFRSLSDKDCEVLQAADAVAYEVRRVLKQSLGQWKGPLRQQFTILEQDHRVLLVTHTTKAQLDHIVATQKPGHPFNLDEVMNLQMEDNISIVL